MHHNKKLLTYTTYFFLSLYGIAITAIGPAISIISRDFGVKEGAIGLLFAVQSVGFLVFVLMGGIFADKYGIKFISLLSAGGLSIGLCAIVFCPSMYFMYIAVFIVGCAGGFIEVAVNTIISELYRESRTASLNLLHVYFGVGAIVGPVYSGYLISHDIRWQNVYLGLTLLSILFFFLFTVQNFSYFLAHGTADKKVNGAKTPHYNKTDKIELSIFFKLLRNKLTLVLGVAMAVYVGVEMGINNWIVFYLEKQFDSEKLRASTYLSLYWGLMMIGRLICMWLAKKSVGAEIQLKAISIFSTISFLLFYFMPSLALAGIFIIFTGFFFSGTFPLIIAIATDRFPQYPGTISGTIIFFSGLGYILFPWLIGRIAQFSDLKTAFILLILLLFILIFSTFNIKTSQKLFS